MWSDVTTDGLFRPATHARKQASNQDILDFNAPSELQHPARQDWWLQQNEQAARSHASSIADDPRAIAPLSGRK
jgi:hypothetical protein